MSAPFAGYQQGGSYSGSQDRQINGTQMWHKLVSGAAIPYDGVLNGGTGSSLTAAVSAGWGVTVAPGAAMVAGYTVAVPVAQSVTHAAATSSARRDLIVLRVRDVEQGDAVNTAVVEIVQGSTTADPAVPARSLVLAAVNIRASSGSLLSTDLVDRRTFTAAAGGVVPVLAAAETTNIAVPPGAVVYDLGADIHYRKTVGGTTVPLGGVPVTYRGLAYAGTAPAADKGLVLFAGQEVVTTNPQGDFTIPIPAGTFTTCVACSGADNIDMATAVSVVTPFQQYTTLSVLTFRVFVQPGVPAASAVVRVGYWALGI